MNRDQKAAVVEEIAEQIGSAQAIFAVDYRGLSVSQAAELRGRLRDADASFRIVKNSLSERAADKAGLEALKALLEGPTALTLVRGDAAVAAKALNDTARTLQLLEFKGGLMNGDTLTADDIRSIARLPAREVLHGQLVGTIAAPLTGLVRGLNALIAGVAVQLQQIAERGLVGGDAEAPAEGSEAPAETAARGPEATEEPPPDPDAEPHEAPVQPDQAEGEDKVEETEQDTAPDAGESDAKEDS